MAERPTSGALAQLQRILYVIPAAAQEGGVDLGEMAETLGVSKKQVFEDLQQVNARASYLPNAVGSQLQFHIDGDRIKVWSTGVFRRPNRLTRLEGLALAVAVRMRRTAGGREKGTPQGEHPEHGQHLGESLKSQLTQLDPYGPDGDGSASDAVDALILNPVAGLGREPGRRDKSKTVINAAESRCACEITYLSSGSAYPSTRTIRPYAIIPAEGYAYAVAHCEREDALRVFRLDRVLEAEMLQDAPFEVPEDFTPEAYVRDGRVYLPEMEQLARVRYSRVVARWVAERTGTGEQGATLQADGSLIVEHTVSDPDWLVRHVLQYAGEAEVLEPAGLRQRVLEVAEGVGA